MAFNTADPIVQATVDAHREWLMSLRSADPRHERRHGRHTWLHPLRRQRTR